MRYPNMNTHGTGMRISKRNGARTFICRSLFSVILPPTRCFSYISESSRGSRFPGLRLALLSSLPILLRSSLDDAGDQAIWNPLIERKPEVALGTCVSCEIVHQLGIAANRRIKADVLFEGGEMHEVPFHRERRHSIANLLRCARRRLFHSRTDFLKNGPDLGRTGRDILINGLGCLMTGFHVSSCEKLNRWMSKLSDLYHASVLQGWRQTRVRSIHHRSQWPY